MKPDDRKEQIAQTLRNLTVAYIQAMNYLEETLNVFRDAYELEEIASVYERCINRGNLALPPAGTNSPVADRRIMSITWRGRVCFLGNTMPFKFFERLARRPNEYVTYQQLLSEVWHGPRSKATVRDVARELRHRLVSARMNALAGAIDGSVQNCYGLMLNRIR